jgi:chromosomal replication initiation ATPase DnaA
MRDWLILKAGRALYERQAMVAVRAIAAQAIGEAAAKHGVSAEIIKSRCRLRRTVRARQEAMQIMRNAGLSLHQIGWTLGRDHTTALMALRQVERRRQRVAKLTSGAVVDEMSLVKQAAA